MLMTSDMQVRAPDNEDELRAAFRLTAQAFNAPLEREDLVVAQTDPERSRCVFVDGTLAAFSYVRPFGEFFGGRSVPMGGFSPVAVAPEFRGRGLGSVVTAAHFPAMRERGEAVSGLYPASTRLYRGVGFELAGAWASFSVPTRSLQMLRPEPGVSIRRATADDIPALKACYRRVAARRHGWLDRPEVWWTNRIFEKFDSQYVYVVDGSGGELDGYIRYTHGPGPAGRWGYSINVAEVVAERTEITLALWRLVGTSSTQATEANLTGSPEHPLRFLLPEQDLVTKGEIRWMLRIIDVAAAVEARGFPQPVTATVDLDLDDRQCDWNPGRWRLTVDGGRGRLERREAGGNGALRLSVNAFAALYSGYASAFTLAEADFLTGGSDRDLDALTAAFSGPTPSIADFY